MTRNREGSKDCFLDDWPQIQPSSSSQAASSSVTLPTPDGSWLFDDFFQRKDRKGDLERDRDPLPFGGLVVVVGVRDVVDGLAERPVEDAATGVRHTNSKRTTHHE
jgi:hypothetical protein